MEISQQIFRSIGITLVHSLWQGAILAAVVVFLLMLAKKSNARYRYGVLYTGLILLLASFVITFTVVYQRIRLAVSGPDLLTSLPIPSFSSKQVISYPLSVTGRLFAYLEPFYPALAIGWLAGFVYLSLRIWSIAIYSRISLRRTLTEPATNLVDIFSSLSRDMNLPAVRLYVSNRMISPLVTGVFKPMVIIPVAAITGLSPEQISTIFVHELAHIARYDHVLIIIQTIARQVLFFHPLTWFLIPEIDRERENCCDDFVVRSQDSQINYIKALAMIQEMNLQGIPAGNHAGKRSKQLLSRISRLIKPEVRHSGAFRFSVITFFVVGICLTSMALVVSDHYDVKSSPEAMATILPDTTKTQKHDENTKASIAEHKESNKKKVEIVYENDSITEMKVNGKKLSREEIEEYENEMHPEMFSFNFRHMPMPGVPYEEAMKHQQFNHDEYLEQMKKFQEEQMEHWKEHQEEWKMKAEEFREEALKQHEYWNQHKEEWQQQMKESREEAFRALEEMRKNGIMPPQWDVDSDITVPHVHSVPVVPHSDIDIDIEVPETPEVPEVPDMEHPKSVTRNHSAEPADTGKSDTKELENKLQELEKE